MGCGASQQQQRRDSDAGRKHAVEQSGTKRKRLKRGLAEGGVGTKKGAGDEGGGEGKATRKRPKKKRDKSRGKVLSPSTTSSPKRSTQTQKRHTVPVLTSPLPPIRGKMQNGDHPGLIGFNSITSGRPMGGAEKPLTSPMPVGTPPMGGAEKWGSSNPMSSAHAHGTIQAASGFSGIARTASRHGRRASLTSLFSGWGQSEMHVENPSGVVRGFKPGDSVFVRDDSMEAWQPGTVTMVKEETGKPFVLLDAHKGTDRAFTWKRCEHQKPNFSSEAYSSEEESPQNYEVGDIRGAVDNDDTGTEAQAPPAARTAPPAPSAKHFLSPKTKKQSIRKKERRRSVPSAHA
eukprot:Hpha_TRINITY_DN16362_c0_g6::TRINITY_DN16362_c0_g6_i1::g.59477::m.59477